MWLGAYGRSDQLGYQASARVSSRAAWAAGSRASSAAACSCAHVARSLSSSQATAAGSSRGAWAAARSASAVTWSCARLPQPVQQPGHGIRAVEADVGGGVLVEPGAASRYRPRARTALPSLPWSLGKAWPAAAAQNAAGELALPVVSAVLVQVIREPVQRAVRDANRVASRLLIAVPSAGGRCLLRRSVGDSMS